MQKSCKWLSLYCMYDLRTKITFFTKMNCCKMLDFWEKNYHLGSIDWHSIA